MCFVPVPSAPESSVLRFVQVLPGLHGGKGFRRWEVESCEAMI